MSKQNLIDTVALETSTSKAEAARAVDAVLHALQSELSKGNKVAIVGFGSFQVKNVVKFKAGTKLLEAVN